MFEKLTDASVLPSIHCNAALALCKLEDRFHDEMDEEEEPETQPTESEDGVQFAGNLSPLQERCASALAALDLSQWDSFLSSDSKVNKLN